MAAKLLIAPDAERDISEAFGWYESRWSGLGEEFLTCVEACIERICRDPEIHANVHEDYRCGLVRRFPYGVFYEYSHGTVTIYGVFHTSREPQKWRQRLP